MRERSPYGFTLIELLLVLAIFGSFMALVIPRAINVRAETRYSQVRQYGSEIASYIVTWSHEQARAQNPKTSFTVKDFLVEDILPADEAGMTSKKLADKYTGNPDFSSVAQQVTPDRMPLNPFNETSYFSPVNNDSRAPSHKAGLLYLAAQPDPRDEEYLNFYLLYTSDMPNKRGNYWKGDMDADPVRIRYGVFVARLYNDREDGASGGAYLLK
jgi:prepilin-type N-terminal cleavage/methylation domain-containing protein